MTENYDRWIEAAPKIAAALSEAGYPSRYDEINFHAGGWREHEITFLDRKPPRDVILRAGEVCGIPDLIERMAPPDQPEQYDDRAAQ